MSETINLKAFDTVDHIAVAVTDVKGTVDWYLKNFKCRVSYQDDSWALLEFANIRVAFVLPQQHPPHFALLRDPALFGEPKTHRDGLVLFTERSVWKFRRSTGSEINTVNIYCPGALEFVGSNLFVLRGLKQIGRDLAGRANAAIGETYSGEHERTANDL